MALLPEPGATNEKGEFIDVIENIRTKKKIGKILLPFLWDYIQEKILLNECDKNDETVKEALTKLKSAADLIGVNLNPNLPK